MPIQIYLFIRNFMDTYIHTYKKSTYICTLIVCMYISMKFLINSNILKILPQKIENFQIKILGPVVQSVVSLMSSLRVISLTVLADSIYNILIFFAEKM